MRRQAAIVDIAKLSYQFHHRILADARMPRRTSKKVIEDRKKKFGKVQDRGKKSPKPSHAGDAPAATSESDFLAALQKEYFGYLAEQGARSFVKCGYAVGNVGPDALHRYRCSSDKGDD